MAHMGWINCLLLISVDWEVMDVVALNSKFRVVNKIKGDHLWWSMGSDRSWVGNHTHMVIKGLAVPNYQVWSWRRANDRDHDHQVAASGIELNCRSLYLLITCDIASDVSNLGGCCCCCGHLSSRTSVTSQSVIVSSQLFTNLSFYCHFNRIITARIHQTCRGGGGQITNSNQSRLPSPKRQIKHRRSLDHHHILSLDTYSLISPV